MSFGAVCRLLLASSSLVGCNAILGNENHYLALSHCDGGMSCNAASGGIGAAGAEGPEAGGSPSAGGNVSSGGAGRGGAASGNGGTTGLGGRGLSESDAATSDGASNGGASSGGASGAGGVVVDPCAGMVCNQAPSVACSDATHLVSYDPSGTCVGGVCKYASHTELCSGGCAAGVCAGDPCVSVVCSQPPATSCTDATHLTTHDAQGTCTGGVCSYTSHLAACAGGCAAGVCAGDPCAGVSCDKPPSPGCKNATTQTTYASSGSCSGGTCAYVPTDVICNMGPAARCKDANTRETYPATGACDSGGCVYAPTDTPCGSNSQCNSGVCAVCKTASSCGSTCSPCAGGTPVCLDQGTTSSCVQCASDADCSGTTPRCKASTHTCVGCISAADCDASQVCNPTTQTCNGQSCSGLAATCGPNGSGDCCAEATVPAGTYNRSNDPAYPATISAFRLDAYEITVGRFRSFVAAYTQTMTPTGSGKNPKNAADPGWDPSFNTSLPADSTALRAALKCDPTTATWTDAKGANEARPINCINWFEAFAFCIWDGGRLPSEAEWNDAAAGGGDQRIYPWSTSATDTNVTPEYASYYETPDCVGDGQPGCQLTDLIVVGSKPKGNGKWGHADLAGNIAEWTLDWLLDPYPTASCRDCANLTAKDYRSVRGGNYDSHVNFIESGVRVNLGAPAFHSQLQGARCARNP